jgi:hypothetical protein
MKLYKWRNADPATKDGATSLALKVGRSDRQEVLDRIVTDLVDFGISQAYTDPQIKGALYTFHETFALDIFLYLQVGNGTLVAAIANDVTIPWLDIDVSGTPLRQRLINRLS